MDRLAFLLPESRPREALSWPSKCRSGNEQDRAAEAPEAAGREGGRRDNKGREGGREEEKGALSFSLCIHSDFPS